MLGLGDIGPWSHDIFTKTLSEIFNKFGQIFIPTSWKFFTKFQVDFDKLVNMKVVDNVSRFPKCPRTWRYHALARSFEEKKMASQTWILGHFVMNLMIQTSSMLHNIALQAY